MSRFQFLTLLALAACTSTKDVDDTDVDDTLVDTLDDTDGGDTDIGDTDVGDTDIGMSTTYAFSGRNGTSSVSYSGQVLRQVLIADLVAYLDWLGDELASPSDPSNPYAPVDGEVESAILQLLEIDSATYGGEAIRMTAGLPLLQSVYDDVSEDKKLIGSGGKIAGRDVPGQHKDWSTAFEGWGAAGSTTPEDLVLTWVGIIDDAAVAEANGTPALGPDGQPVPAVYVTADGLDLKQLLEKFLRGSVAFSQGADDYLDDDTEGKGLLADHTELVVDKDYTALEHAWDEGFGYFGASQDYGDYTLNQIADDRALDSNGDGSIDLGSEYVFGYAVNTAKRDRGANVATDFTGEAWRAFLHGRELLDRETGALDATAMAELTAYRDQALDAWEKAIASTAVHYVNDVLADMKSIGGDDYAFGDHAKHWAELKGFALSLQFNPHSPMTDAQFTELHTLLGDAPVLSSASDGDRAAYKMRLHDARTLLGTAYGFAPENLGVDGDDGENGW